LHDQREIDAVVEVLRGGPTALRIGRCTKEMERLVAQRFGKRRGIIFDPGSPALDLAIERLGLEPGAEIPTSPLTLSTDLAPMFRSRRVPVFVDVTPDTDPIDAERIERNLGRRTEAILAPKLSAIAPTGTRSTRSTTAAARARSRTAATASGRASTARPRACAALRPESTFARRLPEALAVLAARRERPAAAPSGHREPGPSETSKYVRSRASSARGAGQVGSPDSRAGSAPRKSAIGAVAGRFLVQRTHWIGSIVLFGSWLGLAGSLRADDVTLTLGAGGGLSVRNNTGATERLRVDEATGNLSRNGALFAHSSGATTSLYLGAEAGSTGSTGTENTGLGFRSLFGNTTGFRNTALGNEALAANTTGILDTAAGSRALTANTTGSSNTAVGDDSLRTNTTGAANTAVGASALFGNTAGFQNTASGASSLRNNTTGINNTAIGHGASQNNLTGNRNTVAGSGALQANLSGSNNTAVGVNALVLATSGDGNTAVGRNALFLSSGGSRNLALGDSAGTNQTTGSDNIYIANSGVAGESGSIRIGATGTHTQTAIAGIHGQTSTGGIAVLVNSDGTLGTLTSSARFKRDVEDMGASSERVMRLRPVVFRYKPEIGPESADEPQSGLIAEEVAQVAPEFVASDRDGKPYSVSYHALPALLLNELQRQSRENRDQSRTIAEQRRAIESLEARLAELERTRDESARSRVAATR
jgi:hypothetical protein